MKKFSSLEQLALVIPKQTYSVTGKPMEPINLVIIGDLNRLKEKGWYEAARGNIVTVTRAILAGIFNRTYVNGPVSPSYIKRRRFFISYERPTKSDTFRRRHHMRLWQTKIKFNNQPVWAGTISYDRAAGVDAMGVIPTHHISPNLLWEEEFLAESLGVNQPTFIKVSEPKHARLNNGDLYDFDGRALVVNMTSIKTSNKQI